MSINYKRPSQICLSSLPNQVVTVVINVLLCNRPYYGRSKHLLQTVKSINYFVKDVCFVPIIYISSRNRHMFELHTPIYVLHDRA